MPLSLSLRHRGRCVEDTAREGAVWLRVEGCVTSIAQHEDDALTEAGVRPSGLVLVNDEQIQCRMNWRICGVRRCVRRPQQQGATRHPVSEQRGLNLK